MRAVLCILTALLLAGCAKEAQEETFEPVSEENVLCEIFADGSYRVDLVCIGGLAYVQEKVGDEVALIQYLENTPEGLCLVRCGHEPE